MDAGTLIVQKAEAEADGPCRDFNYDPTILPTGIAVSDDPLLPARSAAYAKSFDLRTAETADYAYSPRPAGGAAMRTERDGFSAMQRVLHWLMAIMVLAMLFIGVSMVSTLRPRFLMLISIHKPLGIAILALAVLRLGVRLRLGAPPLPGDLPWTQALAAKLSQVVLYALLIAIPLVGWAMLSAGGYPVVLYGSLHLPAILPHDDQLYAILLTAHIVLAYTFFAIILLHVAAALFHALVRRDGIFRAMAGIGPRIR